MAARKNSSAKPGDRAAAVISSEEKIARLLGLLLVKNMESKLAQVSVLRSAGFQVPEIAVMLGITDHHVVVAAHSMRKKQTKKKRS